MRPVTRTHAPARLLALALLLGGCAFSGEPQQPGFTQTRLFAAGTPVRQTFTARGGTLSSFDLLVATFEKEEPAARLTLVLSAGGEERAHTVAGADIADAAWLRFPFPPLRVGAGEAVTATLRWEGDDPLAYYVNPGDPYPGGALEPGEGDLAFRVGHHGRVRGLVPVAGRMLAEPLRHLRADPLFAVVWVLGLGLAAATAARGRLPALPGARRRDPDHDDDERPEVAAP